MISKPPRSRRQSDEILFRRSRSGDEHATSLLYRRYYANRFPLAEILCPESFHRMDDLLIHDAFTDAFCYCLDKYDSKRATFRTFFKRVFLSALVDGLRHVQRDHDLRVISLDERIYNPKTFEISDNTLHDVIPDTRMLNDPEFYYRNKEALEVFSHPPKIKRDDTWRVAKMVHVHGFSISETSRRLHMKRERARYLLRSYDLWAKKVAKEREKA